MQNKVFLVSPTESIITQRGKRHPNLANFLHKKNIEVNYITSTFNHSEKRVFDKIEINSGKRRVLYNIHFIGCGSYSKNISFRRLIWNLKFAYKIYKHLMNKCNRDDIIISPSRPSELLLVAKIVKKKRKVRLFIDIEDIWPDAFLIKNPIIKKSFYSYCNLLNRISIPAFDAGVHVSPNFKCWLNKYRPTFSSTLATLGINSIELKTEYKKKYLKEPNQLILFYGGTLTLQFDIFPVIKAMKNSEINVKIVLVGDNGSGERYNKVISYLNINNINFENHGVLSKEKYLTFLGASDIAIVPMISGGLPKKFFDAIGCYKPILCLGSGGVSEEVKKYNIGWSVDFNDKQVLEVLSNINIVTLNEKINNISLNNHRYLEQNSLNSIYKELQKLF